MSFFFVYFQNQKEEIGYCKREIEGEEAFTLSTLASLLKLGKYKEKQRIFSFNNVTENFSAAEI